MSGRTEGRTHRRAGGFTLIELLVVVLIIGILASIAIPQYFKVVERARISEAQSFAASVKDGNERYLARNGQYASSNADLTNMDIIFSGSTPNFGMKYYAAALANDTAGCSGSPGYNIVITRVTTNAGVATRYGAYSLLYQRCIDQFSYPNCANCATDFAQ